MARKELTKKEKEDILKIVEKVREKVRSQICNKDKFKVHDLKRVYFYFVKQCNLFTEVFCNEYKDTHENECPMYPICGNVNEDCIHFKFLELVNLIYIDINNKRIPNRQEIKEIAIWCNNNSEELFSDIENAMEW
jgi:hypothetical protein